jgi:hypothetical protein
MKKPKSGEFQLSPWEGAGPTAVRRFWIKGSGGEAARVAHAPTKEDPNNPYLWMIWGPKAGGSATHSGRAATLEDAKDKTERAIQSEIVLAGVSEKFPTP